MKALIDGDILRYEIGFAAETGWEAITEGRERVPPFNYVEDLLLRRIQDICDATGAITWVVYMTEGATFREDVAVTKPYKGNRQPNKPWHYGNLTVYMKDILKAKIVPGLEADDALSIDHLNSKYPTILVSRDKDLRQVPGLFYSWELGRQPSFGPVEISELGSIELSEDKKKINATGFLSFCAQLLTGDRTDNIPGLEGVGPVGAYEILEDISPDPKHGKRHALALVEEEYASRFGLEWEEYLLEQGQLLWMVRRFKSDGSPELWSLGQME